MHPPPPAMESTKPARNIIAHTKNNMGVDMVSININLCPFLKILLYCTAYSYKKQPMLFGASVVFCLINQFLVNLMI
jgi:hypothetical protein